MCERTAEIWLLRSSSLDAEAFGCARSELGRLDTPLQLLAAEPFPPRGWVTPSQASGLLASGSTTGVPAKRASSFTSRDLQFESLAVLALLVGIGNGGAPSATSTCHPLMGSRGSHPKLARNEHAGEQSLARARADGRVAAAACQSRRCAGHADNRRVVLARRPARGRLARWTAQLALSSASTKPRPRIEPWALAAAACRDRRGPAQSSP